MGSLNETPLGMGTDPTQYAAMQYTASPQGGQPNPSQQGSSQTGGTQAGSFRQQAAVPHATTGRKTTRRAATANRDQALPGATLGSAMGPNPYPAPSSTPYAGAYPDGSQQQVQVPDAPQVAAPSATGSGLSDQDLQERNLPPLRGPWVRIQRERRAPSPRDEAEMQLRTIESSYSPWLGGAGIINYRSGNLGFDHLSALEAPFEVSAPLGYSARFTIVARPVFLDSGQADGTAIIQVQQSTTAGTALVTIPEPLGTDSATGPASATSTGSGIPPQQNATGLGGEVQLAFPHLSLAAGYTPFGFLVSNATGRFQWKPGNGPFTFSFNRDSIKDTQLSYAGMRDPGSASLSYPGNIWGGVIANQGSVQFARGDAESGFYLGVGGQDITGYNVKSNSRVDGSAGAYWHAWTSPEYGSLNVGANFFAMHYAQNQQAFTFGMGGYFSPQVYFLANIPFTWTGHYLTRWHYNILGSLACRHSKRR